MKKRKQALKEINEQCEKLFKAKDELSSAISREVDAKYQKMKKELKKEYNI